MAKKSKQEEEELRDDEWTEQDLAYLNALARRIGTDKIRIVLDVIDQNTPGNPRSLWSSGTKASRRKGKEQ
jgi:hypothetical protein